MKKMKSFLSILMAATMTLAMSAPGFASEGQTQEETGTITITNATAWQEYAAYKLFDANPSGSGDLIAYTATDEVRAYFAEQTDAPFTFTQVDDTDLYNVGLKEGVSDKGVTEFLQGLVVGEDGKIDTGKGFFRQFKDPIVATAEEQVVTLTVPYGYYLVTSSLGSVVSINSTNKDVRILDKNQKGPSWDDDPNDPDDDHGKKIVIEDDKSITYVTGSSAAYGETVDFQIKFSTTDYVGEDPITQYNVYDTIEGMDYIADADGIPVVTVMVGEEVLSAEEKAYEITPTEVEGKLGFKITIDWGAVGENGYTANYASPSTITVKYSATVTEEAIIAGEGNKNTAWFTYNVNGDNDEDEERDPEEGSEEGKKTRETTTYTFALGIYKTDEDGKGLEGAEFKLPEGLKVKKADDADGVYLYAEDGDVDTVVSSAEGTIVIKGVKAGLYSLTETKAPAGYNLLTGPVEVEASMEEEIRSTYTTKYFLTYEKEADGSIRITEVEESTEGAVQVVYTVPVVLQSVINRAGAMLPSTGGIGTTIFYAAGILLMAGALFFVVRRKRA